jgi:hypothetical protein
MPAQSPRDEREPASPGYEEEAARRFPIHEMTPERYVALHGHGWLLGGIFTVGYADPDLDAWVRRAGELLRDYKNIDALRREWLSPEEYEQVKREEEQANDNLI